MLGDVGAFDSRGTTCLLPGADAAYSTNVFDVDYFVTCDTEEPAGGRR